MSTVTQLTAENPMRAARKVAAYVIIARYNLAKERKVTAGGEHAPARDAALALFPYKSASQKLPYVEGAQTIHTFNSPFFDQLPDDFFDLPEEQQIRMVNSVIAELGEDNLGIGWMAVIDASSFGSFVARMGGENGPLWRTFDIEVIALNDDQTTNDIYQLMTPVNWGH